MSDFNYTPTEPVRTFKAFTWGVYRAKVDLIEVKELDTKSGKRLSVSCTLSDSEGRSARYVNLGFYPIIANETENKEFNESVADIRRHDELGKVIRANDGTKEADAAKNEQNAIFNKWKGKSMYNLAKGLESLNKFAANFGAETVKGAKSVADYITKVCKSIEGKEAYVFLMRNQTEKAGKIHTNVHLSQNFQDPRSFSIHGVERIEYVNTTDGEIFKEFNDEVTVCNVVYSNPKARPTQIKRTDKNYVTLAATVPNDDSDLPSAGFVPPSFSGSEETDDLPF